MPKTCMSTFVEIAFCFFYHKVRLFLREFSDSLPLKKYLWTSLSFWPSDLLELFIVLLLKGTEIIWHPKIGTSYFHTEPTVIFSNNPKSVDVPHKLSQSQTRSCCSPSNYSRHLALHTRTHCHTHSVALVHNPIGCGSIPNFFSKHKFISCQTSFVSVL